MARQPVHPLGTSSANVAERMPRAGDYDKVDPNQVEVIARGPALRDGRPFVLTVEVPLDMDTLRAITQAARAEGIDAAEYVQRAVQRLGDALRNGKA